MARQGNLRPLCILFATALLAVACAGKDGKDGATGPQGATGATGATGAAGATGAKGDPGESVASSVGIITPSSGFLARSMTVSIMGDAVTFDSTTTVSFGDKIDTQVTVISTSALEVALTIDAAAAVGPRDVTVTTGTATLTAKGAFNVQAPLKIVGDDVAQGGIVILTIQNLDPEHQLDPASVGDANSDTYNGFTLDAPGLYNAGVTVHTGTYADAIFLADVLAPVGPVTFTGAVNDADGEALAQFPAPNALNITAHTPAALTLGTKTPSAPFPGNELATQSFKFTVPAASVGMVISELVGDANMVPYLWTLPGSGKFADAVAFSTYDQYGTPPFTVDNPQLAVGDAAADDYYLVALDVGGAVGASFNVTPTLYAMTGGPYLELGATINSHSTPAGTNPAEDLGPATGPSCLKSTGDFQDSCVVTGELKNVGKNIEVDVYKIHLATAGQLEVFLQGSGDFEAALIDAKNTAAISDFPDLTQQVPVIDPEGGFFGPAPYDYILAYTYIQPEAGATSPLVPAVTYDENGDASPALSTDWFLIVETLDSSVATPQTKTGKYQIGLMVAPPVVGN